MMNISQCRFKILEGHIDYFSKIVRESPRKFEDNCSGDSAETRLSWRNLKRFVGMGLGWGLARMAHSKKGVGARISGHLFNVDSTCKDFEVVPSVSSGRRII